MNRYMEAILVGAVATAIAYIAGIGAGTRSEAATAPVVAVTQSAARMLSDLAPQGRQSQPPQQIEVRSQISGRVTSMNVVPDQRVRKGEVLLVIDPVPYETAVNKAQVKLSKAQWRYEIALRARSREAGHQASHLTSRQELDARIDAAKQARAEVEEDKAALAQARLNLDNTRVTAPTSGVVGRPIVTVGTLVEPGQSLMTSLAPSGQLEVARY